MRDKMKVGRVKLLAGVVILVSMIFGVRFAVVKIYPFTYRDYILKYAEVYKLDPYFVAAVIKAESNFRSEARSHRDAVGLMQITEDTGAWIAEQLNIEGYNSLMLYDPETNIRMGCWYLDNLRMEFKDNPELILASYNAGRGNVNSWLQNPRYSRDGRGLDYIPFEETDKYIKRVKVNYNIYNFLYGRRS
jgi:soluble lytic murein transglycosylase